MVVKPPMRLFAAGTLIEAPSHAGCAVQDARAAVMDVTPDTATVAASTAAPAAAVETFSFRELTRWQCLQAELSLPPSKGLTDLVSAWADWPCLRSTLPPTIIASQGHLSACHPDRQRPVRRTAIGGAGT